MERETHQRELHLEAHLCLVIVLSLLSAALFVETLIMGWERWTLPIIGANIICLWTFHVLQAFGERYRVYLYLMMVLVELFFYGSHITSLYDVPIMVILILGLFSLSDEELSVFWISGVYILLLFYHHKQIIEHSSPLEISRLMLDIIGVASAAFLSRYAIRRRKGEHIRYTQINDELKQMNERTENFLTNVSHELRTPINAVSGITEVLLKNEESQQKRDSLLSVQQAGRRLFSQISDILDFTEIDTGRLVTASEPYMISSLVNDLLTEIQMMHYADDLEVIFDVDTQMPSVLIGDSQKIRKILHHLIENACKFTKEGGVYVYIRASKKDYGVNLALSVSDTGIGIDVAIRSQIVGSFYQADAGRSRKSGGMGLGLSIVQGLTLAMGGFMHIDAARGGGTVVQVCVPQKVGDTRPCMSVGNVEKLCVACYLRPEKYRVGAVREYYSRMIEHLASSLHIPLHSINTLRDLKRVQQSYLLTHVFVADEEYVEDPAYFEGLPADITVTVVAEPHFVMPARTRCRVVWKPFNSIPIVSILNNEKASSSTGVQAYYKKRFVCPSVKVLVVDDDEMNLIVAKGIFGDYQMQVTTATSGAEALTLCAQHDYDIVFMDHMMPEMDGVEAMHQLKKLTVNRAHPPVVVALTANAVSGAREMFMQEGFDGFVPKPVETSELERVLRHVLPESAFKAPAAEPAAVSSDSALQAASVKEAPLAEKASSPEERADVALDPVSALSLAGINTHAGIGYCGGSEDFYIEMLEKYVHDAPVREKELIDALSAHDINRYEIKVHALKSGSKTVGIDDVFEIAKELEEASHAGSASVVEERHAALMEMLEKAVAAVASALGMETPAAATAATADCAAAADGDADTAAADADTPAAAGVHEALLVHLRDMQGALDMFEGARAAELLSAAAASTDDTAAKAALSEISVLVDGFELEGAAQKTAALIKALEGEKS